MNATNPLDAVIVIPFRDRDSQPSRGDSLIRVCEHWHESGIPVVVAGDGRSGDDLFNRSAAYNRGAAATDARVLAFIEVDILLPHDQLYEAIEWAEAAPGLVVPFTRIYTLYPDESSDVQQHRKQPQDCLLPNVDENITGPANVISRDTLTAVGRFDEAMEGHGYDDLAMERAFQITCGPTRRVEGPAYHMHHVNMNPNHHPGISGEDVGAATRNAARWTLYTQATTAEQIRELTTGIR